MLLGQRFVQFAGAQLQLALERSYGGRATAHCGLTKLRLHSFAAPRLRFTGPFGASCHKDQRDCSGRITGLKYTDDHFPYHVLQITVALQKFRLRGSQVIRG